ncbi:MAG: DNA repair protein RecO, partial [Acidimicrobiia bacterium]|nr:DNA repair protein RecO [Acidimicrobiia bacterium]
EPFTHVELVLFEGRNLDTITQVEVVEAFPRLRSDLDKVTAASTMVEAADAVAQENESSMALFDLLRSGLSALEDGAGGADLVSAFLLQLAGVVGVAPALEHCAACGRPEFLTRFSFEAGGVMCDDCRESGGVRLRSGLVEYLAALARADLASLPATDASFSGEAMGVARRFVEHHLDRRLASLAALDS